MTNTNKTPAPAATGNKGQTSNNLQRSERPRHYHWISHKDGRYLIARCGYRFKEPTATTTTNSTVATVLCPLCEVAKHLNTEVKW